MGLRPENQDQSDAYNETLRILYHKVFGRKRCPNYTLNMVHIGKCCSSSYLIFSFLNPVLHKPTAMIGPKEKKKVLWGTMFPKSDIALYN